MIKRRIKVIEHQHIGPTVIDEYVKNFKNKNSLLGYLITTEEYLNDGPGCKIEVIDEDV